MTSSAPVADPMISSPPSDDGPTVVFVFVFVSLGCFILLAICLFSLWFLIKRRKKKSVEEIDIKRGSEHLKVKEDVVKGGPHGPEAVVLSIEEDKHFEEEIVKNEKKVMNHNHGKLKNGEISSTDLEVGESSSKS